MVLGFRLFGVCGSLRVVQGLGFGLVWGLELRDFWLGISLGSPLNHQTTFLATAYNI